MIHKPDISGTLWIYAFVALPGNAYGAIYSLFVLCLSTYVNFSVVALKTQTRKVAPLT